MQSKPSDSTRQRRSARIDFRSRVVVSGFGSNGKPFRTEAETVQVSLYGARIRCAGPLEIGMEVRLAMPARNQARIARVVWERITGEAEFGVELQAPGTFWGITFPPHKEPPPAAGVDPNLFSNQRPGTEKDSSVAPVENEASPAAICKPEGTGFPRHIAKTAKDEDAGLPDPVSTKDGLIEIPAEGIRVMVSGISVSRSPFQQAAALLPVSKHEAVLSITHVVDTGATLRVIFPGRNRSMFVRVTGLTGARETKNWSVWVELPADLLFARGLDGKLTLTW
jgi:hypothetical protein